MGGEGLRYFMGGGWGWGGVFGAFGCGGIFWGFGGGGG